MKRLLILLTVVMFAAVPAIAQDGDCCGDMEACNELLIEASDDINTLIGEVSVCERELEKCDQRCGWLAIAKDRTLQAVLISGAIALVGGIAGIFLIPGGPS